MGARDPASFWGLVYPPPCPPPCPISSLFHLPPALFHPVWSYPLTPTGRCPQSVFAPIQPLAACAGGHAAHSNSSAFVTATRPTKPAEGAFCQHNMPMDWAIRLLSCFSTGSPNLHVFRTVSLLTWFLKQS